MKLPDSQSSKKASYFIKVILGVFLSFNLLLTPVALGVFVGQQSVVGQAAGFVSGAVAPEAQAQGNQKATPKPAAKKNSQPNFLQQLWNFITAPFKALLGGASTPKATPKPKVTAQTTPAQSPSTAPTTEGTPTQTPSSTSTNVQSSTGSAPVVVKSLPKGVTYIDLIGKTIIDSNGKIYPSNDGLALSEKPSLGTSTNKFYGLFVRDFEVSKDGDVIARGKVTLGDENTDKLDFVGRVISDFVPRNNDEVSLGKSGNAWLQAFITTVRSSTVNTGTLNVSLVKLDDGTAAAPALTFTSDTNTGLWRIGADQVALTTAGSATSGITINASGNLGVGTTSPNSKLSVIGAGAFGSGFGSMTAPTNGLLVEGSVGIGISVPSQTFQIGTAGNSLVFTSGGNLGVGVTTPLNTLDIVGTTQLRGTGGVVGLAVTNDGRVGIGRTNPGSTLALAVQGNVGVGVTTANSTLAVAGNGVFGTGFAGIAGPTSGLLVQGNVGLGTSVPSQIFQIGTGSTALVFTSGGNLGIGTTSPAYDLEVMTIARIRGGGDNVGLVVAANGNVGIGTTAPGAGLQLTTNGLIGYTGNVYGPASGLAVSGNVGIGVTTANNALQVAGAGLFSTTWGGANAPTNGLIVEGNTGIGISQPGTARLAVFGGNVGLGVTTPNSTLAVAGNGVFGAGFAGMAATTNGLLIEGSVGIGISVPSQLFQTGTAGNAIVHTSGGNLGVGVTTPLNTLDVVGTTQLRGTGGVVGLAVTNDGRVGIGRTNPGSTLALAVQGNVGVGVTTANSTLAVAGNGVFGAGFAGMAATTNGLLIEGSVGIGISVPSQLFQVGTAGSALAFTSGGNLGVGVTTPLNTLDIVGTTQLRGTGGVVGLAVTNDGRVGIGRTNPGSTLALAVQGNVGVGVTTANSTLAVAGNGVFGAGFAGMAATTNGLLIEGSVGIGISVPSQLFQVGTAGSALAFTSGGNLGVGTTTPTQALEVIGTARIRGAVGNNGLTVAANGNVGIGTTAPGAGLQLTTNGLIGYTGNVYGPASGLAVSGNVGAGTTTPSAALHAIGSTTVNAQTFAAIFEGGNVGIGTSAPNALLVVGHASTATSRTYIDSLGNVGIGTSTTGSNLLTVGTTATGQVRVSSTGNVGIGTTYLDTGYKLDVGGAVRATGYFGNCGTVTYTGNCNQDIAEIYEASEDVAPGDLVAVNSENQRQVQKSQGAYDSKVMGIVSTSPGLLLGVDGQNVALGAEASGYPETADPRKPAVALNGKVPVKVSTENGAIKSGDYLTAASISGVAMKATKAGFVVGQALDSYDGAGVGKILVFVRLGYFNGASLVDMVDQTTAIQGVTSSFSQIILAKLLAEREATLTVNNASELLTDRIAAGVEIITPELTADNIIVGLIRPAEGKNLNLSLTTEQVFNITNSANEPVITFDAAGNAYFKGEVVAESVRANTITGLRVLTDEVVTSKVTALLNAYKVSSDSATSTAVAGASASTQPAIDTSALVTLNKDGGITIGGSAEFKGQSLFASIVEFVSNVVLKGDVSFIGRVFLPKDSVGTAVVKAGADSVTVSFARGYDSAPSVNVTQTSSGSIDWDVRFVVQSLSGSGFTIKLKQAAASDMLFSWTAFSQSNSFTSTAPAAAPASAPALSSEPAVTPVLPPTSAPSVEPPPPLAPSATPIATDSGTPQ